MEPVICKKKHNLLDYLFNLLIIRSNPLCHPEILTQAIVLPLAHTGCIHPWVLFTQCTRPTWDCVINFIASSLSLSDIDSFIDIANYISYVLLEIDKAALDLARLPLLIRTCSNITYCLASFWRWLVIVRIYNAVANHCKLNVHIDTHYYYINFKSTYSANLFIVHPFECQHSLVDVSIRDQVFWYKSGSHRYRSIRLI